MPILGNQAWDWNVFSFVLPDNNSTLRGEYGIAVASVGLRIKKREIPYSVLLFRIKPIDNCTFTKRFLDARLQFGKVISGSRTGIATEINYLRL